MINPNAILINAPGTNCNDETEFALRQAGAEVEQVNISQLDEHEKKLDDYQILVIAGGFAHGDDIAAGRIFGNHLRFRHGEELDRFVTAGKAMLGICNGMQTLVQTGIIPDGRVRKEGQQKTATLAHNASGRFECRWAWMKVEKSTSHFMSPDLMGVEIIELPDAHAEGRWVYYEPDNFPEEQVPLRFTDENGEVTEDYPANPNGSKGGVTAVSNKDGNALGMMPHPERFVLPRQHYNWHRGQGYRPYGATIFKNIVNYARES
jgi:phosphoribosylformylglycinamidine synthase I